MSYIEKLATIYCVFNVVYLFLASYRDIVCIRVREMQAHFDNEISVLMSNYQNSQNRVRTLQNEIIQLRKIKSNVEHKKG
jgi:hypothetical protein